MQETPIVTEASVHAEMLRLIASALRHPDPLIAAQMLDQVADDLEGDAA